MNDLQNESTYVFELRSFKILRCDADQTEDELDDWVIFDGVLVDPEGVSNGVSGKVLQNVMSVLSCTNPLKTVSHDWEAFGLVDGHAFL